MPVVDAVQAEYDGHAAARAEALAEIRAGVEGLRQWWAFDDTLLVSRAAVLALLEPT